MSKFKMIAALALGLASVQSAHAADAAKFVGVRVAVEGGLDIITFDSEDGEAGGVYGATVGGDFKLGRSVVMGFQGGYDRSSLSWGSNELKDSWRLGGRVGYAISETLMVYEGIGYANTKFGNGFGTYKSNGVYSETGLEFVTSEHMFLNTSIRYTAMEDERARFHVLAGVGVRF